MMTDEERNEYHANEVILEELRKIHDAQYKDNYDWNNNELSEKVSAMDMTKLEALIRQEQSSVKYNDRGAGLLDDLLCERRFRSPRRDDFRMTDKKYQKFVQLNDAFMEAYKLAKAEAEAIVAMLKKRKKTDTANPLLKDMDNNFRIEIIITPVFYHWNSVFCRRENDEWRMKNKQLAAKYNFYEALEWAFEKFHLYEIECDQCGSFEFEYDEEKNWHDKDPDGNLGPTNWAFGWIPWDSKYFWKHRFCYIMHILGNHSFLTLDDILKIKRINVKFKIDFGDTANTVLVK